MSRCRIPRRRSRPQPRRSAFGSRKSLACRLRPASPGLMGSPCAERRGREMGVVGAVEHETGCGQQFPLRRSHIRKVRREGEITNGQAAATLRKSLIRGQIAPSCPEKSTKNFSETPYFPRIRALAGIAVPGVELLVRAKTNRVLGESDADKLFETRCGRARCWASGSSRSSA